MAVVIYLHPKNIINGTLFYCYEHLLHIKEYEPNTKLYILGDLSDNDKSMISNMLNEKYTKFDDSYIKYISKTELLKLRLNKCMILDERTYGLIPKNMKKIFLYSNSIENVKYRPQDNIYGWYDYQTSNIKEKLKLGMKYFRKFDKVHKTFISYLINTDIDKSYIDKIAKYNTIYKDFTKHYQLLKCKEIIYFTTGLLDRNNRLIPECYYHNIELKVLGNIQNDSIKYRLIDCENDFNKYNIDNDYRLIKDYISYKG